MQNLTMTEFSTECDTAFIFSLLDGAVEPIYLINTVKPFFKSFYFFLHLT